MPSDDIIICTTQTAIRAYSTEAVNIYGNKMHTPFRQYVDSFSETEFFVVVDEAHHTPAYGCRNLLISLRESMKNLYILGLTATPVHNNERISGWLWKIYDKGICYKADINVLQTNSILSVPVYIEKQTGIVFEVDDNLYKRLTSKHKDLPEVIIEKLAHDASRNNYIVSDYVNNKKSYGKTLIFADRWFRCEYIVEKLKSQGIRANAVYSKIQNSNELFADGNGRRNNQENEAIMKDFRNFKKAFDHAVNRILIGPDNGKPTTGSDKKELPNQLTNQIKQQVYKRDNYQCLCCGRERRKGVSLEIDHILPIAMGGKNAPSNFQTLCRQCNGINEDYFMFKTIHRKRLSVKEGQFLF